MPKIVGLIGYPLGHSVSPAMHNAAFLELGIDLEYDVFEIEPDDLANKISQLREETAGFNVTVPYKEKIMPLLDEIDPLAQKIGAVNTVVNQKGKLTGYNTDGAGFIESLRSEAATDPADKNIVVLGAGGASRAVTITLADVGAKSITIYDIENEKANRLAMYVEKAYPKTKCPSITAITQKQIDQADILVNCSPVGMMPKIDRSPLPKKIKLQKELVVYDLVYNPRETKLLKTAGTAGCKTCSGLGMLVNQGALAFELWVGQKAPVELMYEAAEAAL